MFVAHPHRSSGTAMLLLALPTLACRGGADDDADTLGAPSSTNLGVAVEELLGEGDLRLLTVSEADQGLDLNGDLDVEDVVAHVIDLATGRLVNTGYAVFRAQPRAGPADAVPPLVAACGDEVAAFAVDEHAQGADLNGDGDRADVIAAVFARASGLTRVVEIALGEPLIGGALVALPLPGVVPGTQRLGIHDARDGSFVEVPFAQARALAILADRVLVGAAEEPGLDLNADGDFTDPVVLVVYDARDGSTTRTGLAIHPEVATAAGRAGIFLSEAWQGGQDLTGDGDARDFVLHVFDPATGEARGTGLESQSFAHRSGEVPFLLVLAREDAAREDWNGDGDLDDLVLHVVDPLTPVPPRSTGLALRTFAFPIASTGRWLGLNVGEREQGLDLDGDGTQDDVVLELYDTWTGEVVNTGQPIESSPFGMNGHVLHSRHETDVDLNGDGDLDDFVLFDWDERVRASRNLGVFAFPQDASESHALVLIAERRQGTDENGDGDREDLVLALYDADAGELRSLELATRGLASLSDAGSGVVLVSEEHQGRDLNEDGDLADDVLFRFGGDG